MSKNKFLVVCSLLLTVTIFSCKKNTDTITNTEEADPILQISNKAETDRIDIANDGASVPFTSMETTSKSVQATAAVYPYELIYNGKINPIKDNQNKPLSALDVTSLGNNYFGVAYMTIGEKYYGGVDVFKLSANNNPELISSVTSPNADINKIKIGGNKIFLGVDLKDYEARNFQAPAVVGMVDINNTGLQNPQYIPLKGYSVTDLDYSAANNKLYAASAENGGLSVISFNNGTPSLTSFAYYGALRAITFSGADLFASNAYSYSKFNPSTAELLNLQSWPVRSDDVQIGALTTAPNGNFLFGNNYALIYVNKTTNALIDQVDLGGWIYSISVVNDKIYIAAGNSIVVATIENGHLKLLAKTHFESTFGAGNFVINNVHVTGDKVVVTCGTKGTYVFTLKPKA
ncbi:hypothetical protein [Nubsella zeaxanthinifaciens]|uniref:hypothetical protein n=1 Tax=Nubsella zeaxanthinifaciens TaxID=392412 RepID=UPI000DE21D18|nr:hypothetical protein [Nubsella zeaxanthinifaciens]